jgi:hypothetical protein
MMEQFISDIITDNMGDNITVNPACRRGPIPLQCRDSLEIFCFLLLERGQFRHRVVGGLR